VLPAEERFHTDNFTGFQFNLGLIKYEKLVFFNCLPKLLGNGETGGQHIVVGAVTVRADTKRLLGIIHGHVRLSQQFFFGLSINRV